MKKLINFFKKDLKYLFILVPSTVVVSLCFVLLVLAGSLAVLVSDVSLLQVEPSQELYVQEEAENIEAKTLEGNTTSFDSNSFENEEWESYKNEVYGYTFDFPVSVNIRELSPDNCNGIYCARVDNNEDITFIDSLNISAYYSKAIMEFDFDEGLEKALFKEPKETLIDGEIYYYIISNEGFINLLAHEYKYEGDILWVKTEHKVAKERGGYYISFEKGMNMSEEKISLFEAVFKTFKF